MTPIAGATSAALSCLPWCMTQIYGSDSYTRYAALMLYSLVPLVAASLYRCLAKALNDYEDHPTPVRKKNMFVVKVMLASPIH